MEQSLTNLLLILPNIPSLMLNITLLLKPGMATTIWHGGEECLKFINDRNWERNVRNNKIIHGILFPGIKASPLLVG
jgi:hypothetical protein